jgi:hypothetical protein
MKKSSCRLLMVTLLALVGLAVISTSCEPNSPIDSSGNEPSAQGTLYYLNLSVEPKEGGTTFPTPSYREWYGEGTQVTITAFPKEGYSFSHWGGDVVGETDRIIVTMDSNKKIHAAFIKNSDKPLAYILRTTSDPIQGGSILPSIAPEGRSYPPDAKVVLSAVPADGYTFSYWTGYTEGDYADWVSPITVRMNSDKVVVAHFRKVLDEPIMFKLTVNVDPPEGGSIYVKDVGEMPTGFGFEYAQGTEVTLIAIPKEGYRFLEWAGWPPGNSITVTMHSNRGEWAYFEKIPDEPQDEPLPPLQETLYASFEGGGQCTATPTQCSCNLVISIEGKDLTGGSYPVTNVTLTVNGDVWDDSGSISETHYTKTVERTVDCDKTFNIEVTATNSIGQTVSSTGLVSTAR